MPFDSIKVFAISNYIVFFLFLLCFNSYSFSTKWQILRRKFGNACSSGLFVEMAIRTEIPISRGIC